MITELVILVEGVILGRVFEQTKRGGTLSFQYDPGPRSKNSMRFSPRSNRPKVLWAAWC